MAGSCWDAAPHIVIETATPGIIKYVYIHSYTCVYIVVYISTCICTYIYIHTYTYMYTHTHTLFYKYFMMSYGLRSLLLGPCLA